MGASFKPLYGNGLQNAVWKMSWEFLKKDKEVLLNFFYYPTKDWTHIRTTNTIESTFATVRHRTRQTKGCGSRKATRAMVYKLTREAEDYWRRINGYDQIDKVIRGVEFNDGEVVNEDELKEEEKGKDAA
jgi:transposase-like protein